VRLQLRRPVAATAVLFAAVGTAVITVPAPALAATAPARVVSVAPAVPGSSNATTGSAPAPAAGTSAGGAPETGGVPAAGGAAANDASSPTLGQTIKRIKLWQSLTSMGILVGSLVLVKRLALRR